MSCPVSLFRESISMAPLIGNGAYGPVFGSSYSIMGCVQPETRSVPDMLGNETVATAHVFFPGGARVGVGDLAEFDGRRWEVVEVQDLRIGGVPHHLEVVFRSIGSTDA